LDLPADAIPPIPAPTQKDAVAAKALAAENSLRAVKELAAAREFLKNKDGVRAAIRLQRILNVSPDLDPEVAAEAQYLMGEIYRESKNVGSAYISYKKVTWDYPESTWAKSANARLAEKELQEVDAQDGKKTPQVRPVVP
jgi:TolA-binding protein